MAKKEVTTNVGNSESIFANVNSALMGKIGIDKDSLNRAFYRTGFISIDYMSGFNRYDENGNLMLQVRGIREDALLAFSGGQNCGKSTLAVEIAGAVVRPFKSSQLIYVGTENGMEPNRLMQLSGLNEDDMMSGRLMIIPRDKCYLEDIRKLVDDIVAMKKNNPEIFKATQLTCNGEYQSKFVPTVIVIDSITAMAIGEVENAEMDVKESERYEEFNNTKFMNKNKITGEAILDMRTKASGANIIFAVIAHCTEKLNLGNTPSKKDFKGLSNDVKILGNKKLLYECELGLFMNKYEYTSKSGTDDLCKKVGLNETLNDDNMINKDLFAVQTQVFKSRYGSSTRTSEFSLVFKDGTFNPHLSLMLDITDRYKFFTPKGSAGFSMSGYDKNFYKKNIPELIRTDSEFRAALVNNIEAYFKDYLDIDSKTKRLRESEDLINTLFG